MATTRRASDDVRREWAAPLVVAMLRDLAIIVAVIVYAIDTL